MQRNGGTTRWEIYTVDVRAKRLGRGVENRNTIVEVYASFPHPNEQRTQITYCPTCNVSPTTLSGILSICTPIATSVPACLGDAFPCTVRMLSCPQLLRGSFVCPILYLAYFAPRQPVSLLWPRHRWPPRFLLVYRICVPR